MNFGKIPLSSLCCEVIYKVADAYADTKKQYASLLRGGGHIYYGKRWCHLFTAHLDCNFVRFSAILFS